MKRKLTNLCLTALLGFVGTTALALDKVDGFYQIATAADLKAFAELVNSSEPAANAILTADIDKGTETYRIGRDGQDYQGVFDGAGHTITYNMTFTGENGAGLFRNVGIHAVIQNLKVQGTLTTNGSYAGGIAGWSSGRIRGCYVDVDIMSSKQGDATDGGIVGMAYNGTIIENCIAKITIQGEKTQNCGGVCGWANDKLNIVNCLVVSDGSTLDTSNGASANISRNGAHMNVVNLSSYTSDPYSNRPAGANYNNYVTQQWGNNNATTVVPLADLADGRICYQLNNDQSKINWVQKIGTDPFPVPVAFGSIENRVYASGPTGCDGKGEGLTYSNSGTAQATAHTFDKYGICTTCGCFNFDCLEFVLAENLVLIKNADDIYLAEGYNRIQNGFKINMKMTDDIEVIAPAGQYIFNTGNWVDGNFDGDGHTLTIGISDVGNYAAFMPKHTGTFENVVMHGSIKTSGMYAGSISGEGRQKLVRNVFSDINITSTKGGDNTSGGFFGMAYNEKTVENCIYAGDFTVPSDNGNPCIGGFSGWAHATTYFRNCAVLGHLNANVTGSDNSDNICRNGGSVTTVNVFVANPLTGAAVGNHDKYTHYTNTAGIANGELAYKLNGNQGGVERFYQRIGTDPMPLPVMREGGLVYSVAANYRCDGMPLGDEVTYSNSATVSEFPDHQYSDGFCTVCDGLQPDFMTPVDGWFEIENGAQLAWWSNYATANVDAKARLMANIDMRGYMSHYVAPGTPAKQYVGTFDGKGYIISYFNLDNEKTYQGVIGAIGGGAVVKDFVLDNTCSIKCMRFGGAIGGTNGNGDVYISGIGNEGTVTTIDENASGILGTDWYGGMTLHISDCYVTGAIKGARESATICSWSNASSTIENCWSTATLEGKYGAEDSFTRGSGACINCYEIEGVGTQNNKTGANRTNLVTAEEVQNGALCYKLASPAFGQLLGTDAHPVFGGPEVFYVGEVEYATMYDTTTGYELNGDVKAYAATAGPTWLSLSEIENIPAGTPVVLKGTYYNLFDADLPAINVANDLLGTSAATEADGTMYVLAKVGGEVGFYQATPGSIIPEGKAYYQSTSGVKAYLFDGDDATGIEMVNGQWSMVNDAIYNVAGQRLQKAQRGINIVNGKKILK